MLHIGGLRQRRKRATPSILLILLLWAGVASILVVYSGIDRRQKASLHLTHPNQPIIPSRNHVQIVSPNDNITWPYRVFKSHSAQPPRVDIVEQGGAVSKDFLFVTAQLVNGPGELDRAPYVFAADGELVFAATPIVNTSTGNFLVQDYFGRPYLTTWRGTFSEGLQAGHGYGVVVLLDEYYEEKIVDVKDESIDANMGDVVLPGHIDVHEQRLTEWGSVLATYVYLDRKHTNLSANSSTSVYNATTTDASHIGGSEQQSVLDSVIYEVDVATQEILWTWSALNHIPVEDSLSPLNLSVHGEVADKVPWDAYHLNSIEPVGRDQLLISVRTTWSIYLINRKDGKVVWTLQGGHGGDFGQPPEDGSFRWQHDARVLQQSPEKMMISLYDNHRNDSPPSTTLTRGLVLELALPPNHEIPPRVIHSTPPGNDSAKYQGNYQAHLSNGNDLLSYGDKTYAVEFGTGLDGKSEERWRARYGKDGVVASYRAFKLPWSGTPKRWDPSLVLEAGGSDGDKAKTTAYISWNGATDVAHWQVYSSVSGQISLEKVGIAKKQGFETMFEIEMQPRSCLQIGGTSSAGVERLSNLVCI